MPMIIYEAGKVEQDTKKVLVETLTKTASELTAIPESSFTVLIKENPIENWGIGGVPLNEMIKH